MRQRSLVLLLVGAVVATMAVLPLINLRIELARAAQGRARTTPEALFNFNFALPAASRLLSASGISMVPRQVVRGKHDWLFLGDDFASGLSAKRFLATPADRRAADETARATSAWSAWLAARGVVDFRILLCPDKDSVYADELPDWDRHPAGTPIDALIERAAPTGWLDARPALLRARAQTPLPLYPHTDTHWNERGAWAGYRALAQAPGRAGPWAWLVDADVRFAPRVARAGDLAVFLRQGTTMTDAGVALTLLRGPTAPPLASDYATGAAVPAEELGRISPLRRTMRLASPQALNPARLLWIRDSYGTALLPFFAATFTDIMQVDRTSLTSEEFARLADEFRPDVVYITVAEREARSGWFRHLPPAGAGGVTAPTR